MAVTNRAPYASVGHYWRGLTIHAVRFTANNTSSPAASTIKDMGGLVDSITRTGVGVHKIALKAPFKVVMAVFDVESATLDAGKTAKTEGLAASTSDLTMTTVTKSTGAATDSTVVHNVLLFLMTEDETDG